MKHIFTLLLTLTGEEEGLWVGATWTQKYTSSKYLSMAGLNIVGGRKVLR